MNTHISKGKNNFFSKSRQRKKRPPNKGMTIKTTGKLLTETTKVEE